MSVRNPGNDRDDVAAIRAFLNGVNQENKDRASIQRRALAAGAITYAAITLYQKSRGNK